MKILKKYYVKLSMHLEDKVVIVGNKLLSNYKYKQDLKYINHMN